MSTAADRFERDDRVRLLTLTDGVPADTEGIVIGIKASGACVVQFGGRGVHEIPAENSRPPSRRSVWRTRPRR